MDPVREIAFINRGAMDPSAFAFAVEAIRIQLIRDFLPAWQNYLPVRRPLEVCGYTDSKDLAPGSFAPIETVRTIDAGILGDHGGIEATDSAWGRALPDSVVMSHEAMEMAGDPFANRWVRLPSGLITALETADAVEEDRYPITATIGRATREVWVSNFVYPAWFGEGVGQLDHMGLCRYPGDNRGYMVVQQDDGTAVNVFADGAEPAYQAKINAKLADQRSRTAARHWPGPRIVIEPGIGQSW